MPNCVRILGYFYCSASSSAFAVSRRDCWSYLDPSQGLCTGAHGCFGFYPRTQCIPGCISGSCYAYGTIQTVAARNTTMRRASTTVRTTVTALTAGKSVPGAAGRRQGRGGESQGRGEPAALADDLSSPAHSLHSQCLQAGYEVFFEGGFPLPEREGL